MEKKYQVFISSTYKDLKAARLKVRDAILSMYHFPVGMEMFGSIDEDQWEVIKRDIDESDYYVLIIGKMFGSEVPNEGISYTQKEFRYAKEKKIPILAFLMTEDAEVQKTFQETDPDRIRKLKAFCSEVETGRMVSYWSKPDELAGVVIASLTRQINRKTRPGWVRTTDFDIEKSHAELLELTTKVRILEEENALLRKITGEKREPNLALELLAPIRFEISDREPIPDYLIKAAEKGKTYYVPTPSGRVREKAAEDLIRQFELRSMILSGFSWFYFIIKNNGTQKATNVTVEIDVPDGLSVHERLDISLLTNIEIPGNFISEKRKKPIKLKGYDEWECMDTTPKGFYDYAAIESWEADGNHIEVGEEEMRHYSGKRCCEFFVTASRPGIYIMNCKIMCSEYAEPKYQQIKIEVVKKEIESVQSA